MPKKQSKDNSLEEIKDLMKKQIALDLFKLNLKQGEIAKKLHMNINVVNNLLKGVKHK